MVLIPNGLEAPHPFLQGRSGLVFHQKCCSFPIPDADFPSYAKVIEIGIQAGSVIGGVLR